MRNSRESDRNGLGNRNPASLERIVDEKMLVPGAGIEPARPQWPLDFKSSVSTSSTTRANSFKKGIGKYLERKTGFEPATPTLARSCSTS